MWQAIGETLPAAMGVALSPFPVIAIVLVLGSPHAVRNGVAFMTGWLVGLGALAALALYVFDPADDSDSTGNTLIDLLRVAIGLAMLLRAVQKWRGRPRRGAEPEMPKWMAGVSEVSGPGALRLGVLLGGLNPKNLALLMSATSSIAELGLHGTDAAVAVIMFVLIGSCTVIGAVVVRAVGGDDAAEPLDAVKRFMIANNTVIMMIVLVLLGAKILGDGLAGLAS
ncbi:MAG: GAP family protein [Actinobacteria bacterium]|nr:GAP family protein [Actinomycetota bacterium]